MFPPETASRRICPRHQVIVVQPSAAELDAELVPMESKPAIRSVARYLGGFESRIAPVTKEELDLVRFARPEVEAIQRAKTAGEALERAIAAYVVAGFGSCVTDPLRDALKQVSHSLREVQS